MLVLSRKVGESVIISEHICVTVVDIKGDKIRLAFDAPQDVRIDRAEVHVRRRAQSKTAMDLAPA